MEENNNDIKVEVETTPAVAAPILKKDNKLSTPQAIVLAAVLIVGAILITGSSMGSTKNKTISEQVGVSKKDLAACVSKVDAEQTYKDKIASVIAAIPEDSRGTPYSIIIGKDGVMTSVEGADSYENVKKMIDDAIAGKVVKKYDGKAALSEPTDHIQGNPNAAVTVIEYSDFECPYCKRFHPTMERIVKESNGNVKWILRQFPIHQHSVEKLIAADCVGKIKGEDAYFKYADLLFGLLKTGDDSVADQL
ncbi:MAG: thioredoxin domain-containing protein [Candidatus Nomurabacteria bacterium]|nr:thioredoxin domain-containing protein [Candidatus Nomurabacteria bacterium]